MTGALPKFSGVTLLTHWALDPLAVIVAMAFVAFYLRAVRRLSTSGTGWPVGRSVTFFGGIVLYLWVSCGGAQAYAPALFSVWTAQILGLFLILPIVVVAGHPVELARRVSPSGALLAVLGSPFGRALTSPFVAPALAPVLFALLFFTPVAGAAVAHVWLGWLLHLLLFVVGMAIALPLVDIDSGLSSLAVGLSMVTGVAELLIDAIPGIALRLSTKPVGTYFQHREVYPWSPPYLHDQQIGGAILWCVAELLDLPFLVLVFRRWIGADAAEAARIDAVLDVPELDDPDDGGSSGAAADGVTRLGPVDAPWWLDDPKMRDKYSS